MITPGARWQDPRQDDECVSFIQDWHAAAAPESSGGAYANFIPVDAGGAADADGSNDARLVGGRNRFDPHKLFRMNQNIPPNA